MAGVIRRGGNVSLNQFQVSRWKGKTGHESSSNSPVFLRHAHEEHSIADLKTVV